MNIIVFNNGNGGTCPGMQSDVTTTTDFAILYGNILSDLPADAFTIEIMNSNMINGHFL